MLDYLEKLDHALFLALQPLGHPHLDLPMWYFSRTLFWLPLYLFFAWKLWKKGNALHFAIGLACVVVLIALSDQISVHLFKEVFERYRPSHHLEIGQYVISVTKPNGELYKGGKFGFISSHAANHFALSVFLYLVLWKNNRFAGISLLLWATLICYSRIYLGVHYPSDIFVGAVVGSLLAILVYRWYSRLIPEPALP